MKRFLTTFVYVIVTAGGFLGYIFFHHHWVKFGFLLLALLTGMRFFANNKSWKPRSIFIVFTVVLIAGLFFLSQFFGWIEYGS